MASPTRWAWVWVNSGSRWWTGRPGVLRFMGSQRVRHDWGTELNWIKLYHRAPPTARQTNRWSHTSGSNAPAFPRWQFLPWCQKETPVAPVPQTKLGDHWCMFQMEEGGSQGNIILGSQGSGAQIRWYPFLHPCLEAQRTLILGGQVQFPCPVITIWSLLSSQGTSFPGGSEVKASACSAGDPGSIPGLERYLGEGNGNPLQYSCLGESHGGRSLVGYHPRSHKELDVTGLLHFHF